MDVFIEQPLPWVGKGILQAEMKAEGYINSQKKKGRSQCLYSRTKSLVA